MTSRMPKVGDKIVVRGEQYRIFYVSEEFGADYEEVDGAYIGTFYPDKFTDIVYADDVSGPSAVDNVQHPSHYTSHPSGVETIEITKHESFLRGNLLKYVLRAPYKGNELEDMKKAQQYLQWEIERLQETTSNTGLTN